MAVDLHDCRMLHSSKCHGSKEKKMLIAKLGRRFEYLRSEQFIYTLLIIYSMFNFSRITLNQSCGWFWPGICTIHTFIVWYFVLDFLLSASFIHTYKNSTAICIWTKHCLRVCVNECVSIPYECLKFVHVFVRECLVCLRVSVDKRWQQDRTLCVMERRDGLE